MLNKIIQFSIKNRLIVLLGLFALFVGGIYSISKLPIDAVPDITNNQVLIITSAPSAGAPDVDAVAGLDLRGMLVDGPGELLARLQVSIHLEVLRVTLEDPGSGARFRGS